MDDREEVEVVSGDCIIVTDDSFPFGSPQAECRVNLSSIKCPKLGNPCREDSKLEPYAVEAKEFLRSRIIGRQKKEQSKILHHGIVATYDYIFIWDDDLGVEHFDAKKYIQIIKRHGLEISQPGLDPKKGITWEMTKRRGDNEVHKLTSERPRWCTDLHLPTCAVFVEIMAPVFSRKAWCCVWHMIQNDLVHGWGLDFALQRCIESAHEKIVVVGSQWIVHQVVPSLRTQGNSENGKKPWRG